MPCTQTQLKYLKLSRPVHDFLIENEIKLQTNCIIDILSESSNNLTTLFFFSGLWSLTYEQELTTPLHITAGRGFTECLRHSAGGSSGPGTWGHHCPAWGLRGVPARVCQAVAAVWSQPQRNQWRRPGAPAHVHWARFTWVSACSVQ